MRKGQKYDVLLVGRFVLQLLTPLVLLVKHPLIVLSDFLDFFIGQFTLSEAQWFRNQIAAILRQAGYHAIVEIELASLWILTAPKVWIFVEKGTRSLASSF